MKNCDIIEALAQKVIDTIYGEWHHEGHIEMEHSGDFAFSLDGRMYQVILKNCGEEPAHD